MAKSVYLIDNKARVILAPTAWANTLLGALIMKGHSVVRTLESPDAVQRSDEENSLVDALLNEVMGDIER